MSLLRKTPPARRPGPRLSPHEVKAAVRKRDGYRCTQCGRSDKDHRAVCGRGLEVHCLAPGTPYAVDVCVTLCGACHASRPKAPHGGSDSVGFRVPRGQLLQALDIPSLDNVSVPRLIFSLLQLLSADAKRTALEELHMQDAARRLRRQKRSRASPAKTKAVEWLRSCLSLEPARLGAIRNRAVADGIHPGSLYRARDILSVQEYLQLGRKWWRLPEQPV